MFARFRSAVAAAGACAAIVLHGTAMADVLFSGSGTWASDAGVSSLSAPDATWSFLFVLPSSPIAGGSTSAISSFSYRLGGVTVAMPALSITFYGAPDGGMFDINFAGMAFSLYGDVVLSGGALALGNYAVFAGIGGGEPVGEGSLSLVQVPAAVPEPATWATFGFGLAGVAAFIRRGKRGARVAMA